MASVRKLGRRYQRYITARNALEQKEDDPKDIWDRIIRLSDVTIAMAIDSAGNDIFPLHGLNNAMRTDLNTHCRDYIEMAIDFAQNIDPTDIIKLLRIRSQDREAIITIDEGTIFIFIQMFPKEDNATIASKCPKPIIESHPKYINSRANHATTSDSLWIWFSSMFAANNEKPVSIVCETFEIHANPRTAFILIKTVCLVGLTLKLVSSLKALPTLTRTYSKQKRTIDLGHRSKLLNSSD
ncbi:unnamed protein product [Didymodactylos carnosus]|uniref:Uncharacterized protein n=1 Tax=Didymodactylos carnosus TaxID=1234261 RepID=A0A8S2GUP2_9BILA|nr:unnamed protein product [Didymodactylos carnosus]CAF3564605.1 unnamed protein product [Didymodactylos carnosus]